MVARVYSDADHISHDPVIGKRLGPHGIHFEARRRDHVLVRARLECPRAGVERDNTGHERRSDDNILARDHRTAPGQSTP